jgi:hypothetical protein
MNPLLDMHTRNGKEEGLQAIEETSGESFSVRMDSTVKEIYPTIKEMDATFTERQLDASELEEYCDNQTMTPKLKATPASPDESPSAIVPTGNRRRFSWLRSFSFKACLDWCINESVERFMMNYYGEVD